MKSKATDAASVEVTLAAIREQLAALTERVTALESTLAGSAPAAANGSAPAAAAPAKPAPAAAEELSEETLLLISAAIAAYLGKKPRIRQIRLVNSANWARQGRAGIHASHAFAVHSRSGATS